MKEHVKNVFRGQLLTSLIYLALGICLVMFPDESVNIICKVIFGIVLMLAGLYHIWTYMSEDSGSTIFNLFTGAILLVLGVFFFKNPQIVELILPSLLAALLLVDSIWTLKTGLRLKKHERNEWQFLVIVSLVFVTLGIVLFMNPFTNMNYTVLFAGWSFIGDAVLDFVSMILAVKGNKAIEKGEISVRKVLEVDIEANKISKEERKERKSIFSLLKRKDAEIVVAEDSDMKKSEETISLADNDISDKADISDEADSADKEKTVKKGFAMGFFGKFRKSKDNDSSTSDKVVTTESDKAQEEFILEEDSDKAQEVFNLEEEPDKVQEVFKLEEEPDKVQEVFKLEEEPDKVQEVFKLEEEPDKVQEVFKLEEEPDKVQEVFKLEEEPDKIEDLLQEADGEAEKLHDMFNDKEEKDHLKELLKLDEGVLEEWKD